MDINGFCGSERRGAEGSLGGLTRYGRPKAVAGRDRCNRVVRPTGPENAACVKSLERFETLIAFRAIVARIDVADPPHESRLHLWVPRVVFLLQVCHHVQSMRSRQVGVDNAVP